VRAELDRSKEQIVSDTADTPVLRARGLRKRYGTGEGLVRAVDDIDLDVAPGETVAVSLHEAGQTLVIVTHDARIVATSGQLGALAGLEG
jgi:ABC-type lipoprotein export system ATPase subunit